MRTRRDHRIHPIVFEDGFRSSIATGAALLVVLPWLIPLFSVAERGRFEPADALAVLCAAWVAFSVVYLTWTHLLFSRADAARLRRIAVVQHHRRPSALQLALGWRTSGTGTSSAALFAVAAAVGTALVGVDDGWGPLLVLATVACSWAAMVYAFALRYLRLDAAGDTIRFDLSEEAVFADFLTMSAMVSAVGALVPGTPQTRPGLAAVRTHTLFAFVFNAFIVAMTVSLVVGLIAS